MKITHILRDGSALAEIKNHVVKVSDVPRAYEILKGK